MQKQRFRKVPYGHSRTSQILSFYGLLPMASNTNSMIQTNQVVFCSWNVPSLRSTFPYVMLWASLFPLLVFAEIQPTFKTSVSFSAISY